MKTNKASYERLICLNGHEAATWDGVKLSLVEDHIIGNKIIMRDSSPKWIDFDKLTRTLETMSAERAMAVQADVVAVITEWGFVSEWEPHVIAGWFFAQPLQKMWSWRAMLWITGPTGGGKTMLIQQLQRIAGPEMVRIMDGRDQSEAGFRQDVSVHSRMHFLDEFEKSQDREKILQRARSAGRGIAYKSIGSQEQKAIQFCLRHMVCFASIGVGLIEEADWNRSIIVQIKKDKARKPKVLPPQRARDLQLAFFAYVLWASFKAKALIERAMDPASPPRQDPPTAMSTDDHKQALEEVNRYDGRLVESFSAPVAMLAVAASDPLESFFTLLLRFLQIWSERCADFGSKDERTLLDDILAVQINVNERRTGDPTDPPYSVRVNRAIGQLVDEAKGLIGQKRFDEKTWEYADDLKGIGIKVCEDGVFIAGTMFKKQLQRTRWEHDDLTVLLTRMDGAVKTQRRMFKNQANPPRGVLVPFSLL